MRPGAQLQLVVSADPPRLEHIPVKGNAFIEEAYINVIDVKIYFEFLFFSESEPVWLH